MKETIELPKELEFLFVTIGQAAIGAYSRGFSQEAFMEFCKGMWETMELNGIEDFQDTLMHKMATDIDKGLGLGMFDYIQKSGKKR